MSGNFKSFKLNCQTFR